MVSEIVRHLRENGPATADELPYPNISPEDRMNGVWKFSPKGNCGGASCGNTAGQLISIYYLREEHSAREVVEKWAEVNEQNIEKSPSQGIRARLRRQGSEFHAAIDEVLPAGGEA